RDYEPRTKQEHQQGAGSREARLSIHSIDRSGLGFEIRAHRFAYRHLRPPGQSKDSKSLRPTSHRFSIAPMMEWTDRHCRFFHRLLTRRALIYTEMITTAAVLRGDRARLLAYDPAEHRVALQLGGSDPRQLAECARIAADLGYDEINLNVGCPSDRVQEGRFGAC